jgi:D-arabinose 1-dehydrogenase-like Zn-dependent alcohol dehydrogenase
MTANASYKLSPVNSVKGAKNVKLPESMVEIEIAAPGDPDVLRPRNVPLPQLAAGELLIRIQAAGVNRADVLQRLGQYPMPPGVNLIPGLEVAGEVVALGAGVSALAVGDKVCALTNGGGYSEYCVVPAGQALPIPQGMDAIQAAAIPEAFFTVWSNLFEIGKAAKGDRVLIHGGASGIGTTALMLCREFGYKPSPPPAAQRNARRSAISAQMRSIIARKILSTSFVGVLPDRASTSFSTSWAVLILAETWMLWRVADGW